MWIPTCLCPDCGRPLSGDPDARGLTCRACGDGFVCRQRVFLPATQAVADAEPDAEPDANASNASNASAADAQYRVVRAAEGYRRNDGAYYRQLPSVAPDDPCAPEWRIRHASYLSLLHLGRLSANRAPQRIADLGAGCGWLSHRLAAVGHHLVAVDRQADDQDGLGACRHYEPAFVALKADFTRLPMVSGQFDLAVFNASLHYAPDPRQALREAHRVLVPGGAIAVVDSPLFANPAHGEAMVRDQLERLRARYGIRTPARLGAGFLTYRDLAEAARDLCLSTTYRPTRGPWRWRLARAASRFRLGRAPAAFGVWIARAPA